MKQMKFLLVALMTVLMGMSVTSCMNGDDNTIYTGPAFAKCTNYFPATFELANGQKLVVNELSMSNLNIGEIYFFYYQFDTAEQAGNSTTLNVTLYAGSTPTSISAKSNEGPEELREDYNKANAPLYTFNSDTSTQPGILFDQFLVIPIMYWVKVESTDEKQKEELNKHSFILTYDFDGLASGATELVLNLNHVINDGTEENVTRDKYTSTYKAYNLSSAIYAFKQAGGAEPTKITVNAQTNSSKNSLTGATNSSWSETLKTN